MEVPLKTFLKPLSKEEEILCIRALADTDEEGQKEAKRLLIERNLRLVAHIARKYQNADEDMEDLISIGTIGLIKAVDSFDPNKNSRLASYAARCIDNELLMMLRARKKISREVSLFEPIGTDKEGNEISLLDIVEQEQPDIVEQMEQKRRLGKLFAAMDQVLTEREKEILYLRYGLLDGEEVTQKEIGKKYGISRSYVSRLEKKALLKLRAEMERQEKAQQAANKLAD